MANPWFRLYAEFATDPKVQMMSEANQRRYIMLLCMRCSNDDVTLHDDEVAFQLRISNEEWAATKAVFVAKNLINENNEPTAWDKRQFVSDSSAERVARHREKKRNALKQGCNVTVTPPEADTDTEVNPPTVVASSTDSTTVAPETAPASTRKGLVCGLLRKVGMADAAPHYLPDEAWASILAKRTDEEIVSVALAKMAARPGKRTGLKYIAPALLEDPEPIVGNARDSPPRMSHYAASTLAAARTIFGTEIEGNQHGNRVIEIEPSSAKRLGG